MGDKPGEPLKAYLTKDTEEITFSTNNSTCKINDLQFDTVHDLSQETWETMNHLCLLNNFCNKLRYRYPDYEYTNKQGPDHLPSFTCVCRLSDLGIEARGSGGSKQKAKKSAAANVFKALVDKGIIIPDSSEGFILPDKSSTSPKTEKSQENNLPSPSNGNQKIEQICCMITTMPKPSSIPSADEFLTKFDFFLKLEQLDTIFGDLIITDSMNYVSVLDQVSTKLQTKVRYQEIPELPDRTVKYYCLCDLLSLGSSKVCLMSDWGSSSKSFEQAKSSSARRMLLHIKWLGRDGY